MSEKCRKNLILIGISGVTCGGKTTTATKLSDILPNSRIISQDNYFLDENDPRHTWIPELNHVNYDILSSLDMDKMYQDLQEIISIYKLKGESNASENHSLSNGLLFETHIPCKKLLETNISFLIVEGFSIFNYKPILHLFDLKYYFTLDRDECLKRRKTREYIPPDCPGYFEQCVWPEHLKQLEEVRSCVKDVKYFDGNSGMDVVEKILADIGQFL